MTKLFFYRLKTVCCRRLYALLFILTCVFTPPGFALAQSLDDVANLIDQHQYTPALAALAPYLEADPMDAHARFLKGVALSGAKQPEAAIAVFRGLTEDFPELPEPYNNLAVIYAQQDQLDNARQALEMAIRTHPSYATAHENLGDIYALLAQKSYSQAVQLAPTIESSKRKLNAVSAISLP
ncbi:MAG: tetratricopeptide repeat protein [Rugosibacter sp.]